MLFLAMNNMGKGSDVLLRDPYQNLLWSLTVISSSSYSRTSAVECEHGRTTMAELTMLSLSATDIAWLVQALEMKAVCLILGGQQ